MESPYETPVVQLPDGRVLFVYPGEKEAQFYDPVTGDFGPAAYPSGWRDGSDVEMADGRILLLNEADTGAEIYDPATGTVSSTGSRAEIHTSGALTVLADGRVLMCGGVDATGQHYLATAEIYDPDTGEWTPTGSMKTAREDHTATLLPGGRVLVAGGDQGDTGDEPVILSSTEVWDPATGQFSPTGSLLEPRSAGQDVALPGGRVLIVGGEGLDSQGIQQELTTAEIYDPTAGKFTRTGSMSIGRFNFSATLLGDDRVLVAGGSSFSSRESLASAELYDPNAGVFALTGSMNLARSGHAAILLHDGRVLIAGGFDGSDYLSSGELYWP
jgi:hypothetical protein